MLLGGLLLVGTQLQAQARLSVQGTIVQNTFSGGATAIDNGDYDILFKLYTAEVGGTAVWSETQTVQVVNGVYSVLLGAVNPLTAAFDVPYFLGTTLPGGPELIPRLLLTSSPYAISLIGQDNRFPSTGNVGIGTNTPGTTLAVDGSISTGQATTTATSYTVAADDHVIFLDHTANQNVTLPAASAANAGRHLMLVNKAAVAKTLTASNYLDLAGATATSVPAKGVVELQSDGSVWRQTGGFKYNNLSDDWRLVDTDNFSTDVEGWVCHDYWNNTTPVAFGRIPLSTDPAHPNYNSYVLRPSVNGNDNLKKQLNLTGIPHTQVKVIFNYHFLDGWEGENSYSSFAMAPAPAPTAIVDSWVSKKQLTGSNYFQIAGGLINSIDHNERVEMVIQNSSDNLWVIIGSTLDISSDDESFAIGNVEIWVK